MYDFARYLNIRSAIKPVLSADGTRAAFLSDITGNFQAWSVSISGEQPAWPQQLTFFAGKVWELHGTPAAPHLIAVSDIGGNERQQFYLITGYGSKAGDQGHQVHRLTTDDQAIHRFGAWSADGQHIVYTSNARNNIDFDYYRMDLGSGEAQLIRRATGNRNIATWSPDRRYLIIVENVGPLQEELYLLNLDSNQEHHLTAATPPARYGQIKWTGSGVYLVSDRLHDQGAICRLDLENGELTTIVSVASQAVSGTQHIAGEMELLALAPNEHQAAYTFNSNGYSRLYLLDLDTAEAHQVSHLPAGVIETLRFSSDGHYLVLDLQTPSRNPNIWLVNIAANTGRRITLSDRAGIPRSTFVEPELVHFNSFDNLKIPALYYLPQQQTPEGGYPCILYVHGGPTHQAFPDFDVRFQYFLSQGYAILAPNVRGSSGYGRQYAALDEVEKRMDSVADLKAVVEWLHDRPEVNSDRIAIYGRSYGGYMVLAALTEYPQLFAAGLDVVGIADWVTFMERTSPWRRAHREQEYGSLAHHRKVLEQISPIHKAGRIKAPLMVVAGDNDPRVPLFESEQIVERVKAAGGVVKFIHYADEGHKISKLANRIDNFTQMAEFLKQHL
jgi:dipeptidyl aminopeptidase/acylaminoacyl peptidase